MKVTQDLMLLDINLVTCDQLCQLYKEGYIGFIENDILVCFPKQYRI